MKPTPRKSRDGQKILYWYPGTYYDPILKKNRTIRQDEMKEMVGIVPKTKEEVELFIQKFNAKEYGKVIRGKRELEWRKEFYNFNELLIQFAKDRVKKSKRSIQNNIFYLSNYVFPFYLSEVKENNLDLWDHHFETFKDWLENDARQTKISRI